VLKVTWRNLVARKVRLAMSAFAIVLGVAFVAGSFIFTDALGGAFDGIIDGTTADVQVAPEGAEDVTGSEDARTVPGDLLPELAALPGAGHVTGTNQVQGVYVIGTDGKAISHGGAPAFAFNYTETKAISGDQILTLTDGDLPVGAGQVALDEKTAGDAGYAIGDDVRLVTPADKPTMTAELTGLIKFGSTGGLAGATITVMDRAPMLDLFFHGKDVYNSIALSTADGVSQTELRDEAAKLLPDGIAANTGDALAKKSKDDISKDLGFISTFLLVFAGVALVVGSFLIVNTFSILVAQRSRELALLRAMGGSKKQVTRSVLAEAFAVGLVGSTIGVAFGYLLALGLKALFATFGFDIGSATFALTPRTLFWSYAVGLVVTMLAAYLPARRASKISPVAAMRDDIALPERALHKRVVVGVCMVVGGAAAMGGGLLLGNSLSLLLVGLGMLAILVGVSLMSPVIGRPVISILGSGFKRAFGSVGVLATQNSVRNPRRTAATASALMIGLTLVSLMAILGQSAKKTTDQAIDTTLAAQFVVSNEVGAPFSPAVADEVRKLDGVASVAQLRQAFPKVDGSEAFLAAADPEALGSALVLTMKSGSLDALDDNSFVVDSDTADGKSWKVGDKVPFEFQAGTRQLTLSGIYQATAALPASYVVTLDALEKGGVKPADTLLYITKEASASTASVRTGIDEITKDLPTVTVKDADGFAAEQKAQIDKFLYIIYALLGLAVLIAVLGIINTLALSVIERTREIGLLRAVGISRAQLRRMIRLESVTIAVLGGVLGIGMGLAFGVSLQIVSNDDSAILSIPWVLLLTFIAVAAVVGVLAAALPARRAASLNVLAAITTE
jgi:putative ABC transport system permease protein